MAGSTSDPTVTSDQAYASPRDRASKYTQDGAEIVKRYQSMRSARYNFDIRWEAMAPYIAPSRRGIITKWSPGIKDTRNVFDSTGRMAAEMMAMFIAGHIINPSQRWFSYALKDTSIGARDDVREWLEECRDITLDYLSTSMFYAEGPESMIDYGGFGTGFLLCEEAPQPTNVTLRGFRGFYFRAERTGRFCIQEGADGLVDTALREYELTSRVAAARWPKQGNEGVSDGVAESAVATPDRLYKFIHAIVPRDKSRRGAGSRGMPWASCWVEFDSKKLVWEGGYRSFPVGVPRYHKTPGEIYGRGRGDAAFPDVWTLNTAKRMGLEDWALKIRPPIMVRHDSVIGSLRLVPGAPTTINTKGAAMRDVIMPWETGSRPEVSHINEEELRKSIREIFFVEQIRQLMEVNKSEMTAFEFAKKIELLFRLMGPVYGRLEWEYLYRLVDMSFELILHAGGFPPPPPAVMQSNGDIDVEFQNPIAKAQRAGDAESIALTMNDLAPFVQLNPDILDRFDMDKTAEGVAMLRGWPAKWMRSDAELQTLRDAKHQQNQADNQMAQMGQAAQAAGAAAPLIKALSEKAGAGGVPV